MALHITALYAGALGFVWSLVCLNVGLTRAGSEIYYGAPENSPLLYKSRCAGTIGDYSSVGLLLLALMEFNEVLSPGLLWWWGLAFTISRLVHAFQLYDPKTRPLLLRVGGFLTTIALLAVATGLLFISGLRG